MGSKTTRYDRLQRALQRAEARPQAACRCCCSHATPRRRGLNALGLWLGHGSSLLRLWVSCVTDGKPYSRFLALPPWIVSSCASGRGPAEGDSPRAARPPNEPLAAYSLSVHTRRTRPVSPPTLHVSHAHTHIHTHTHTPPHHRLSPAQPRSHGTHDARPNRARGVQACSSNAACTVAPTY